MRHSLQQADSQIKNNAPRGRPGRAGRLALLAALLACPWPFASASAAQPAAFPVPGKPVLDFGDYSLAAEGYAEREFFVTGKAVSYLAGRDEAGNPIGRPWRQHGYATRIVVLTPLNPGRFNGTVVVEWLNVSTGRDIPVDWIMLHREILRGGYAYVAVSAQKTGVEGRGWPFSGPALKAVDPARYASLSLPGDAYSFDIFSDIGRLLKRNPAPLLGGLRPRRLLAVGDSQSAFYLTTYVNLIDPVARVYDGFLIHSRAGAGAALDWNTLYSASARQKARPVYLRGPRVPVLQLITETDLTGLAGFIGYAAARQPDSARLRSWEIAGAAHVDNYLMGGGMIDTPQLPLAALAASWAPKRDIGGVDYPLAINDAPQHHYVAEAALAALNAWVATGKAPPHGPPIALRHVRPPVILRDAYGNAMGGIRTPWVDVPTGTLSGVGGLTGSVIPFGRARLAILYPGGEAQYMRAFAADLDRTIAAGFILPADRAEILGIARADYPGRPR